MPSPNLKQNTGQTVNHAADLKVMHTATDPVDQPCDDANGNMKCPWPKQLFLQEGEPLPQPLALTLAQTPTLTRTPTRTLTLTRRTWS